MPANLEISTVATGLEKVSFHSNPKEGNAKEYSKYCRMTLISHASKVAFKTFKIGFNSTWTLEFPDVQAGFRKGRRTRDQIANICWIIEKAIEFQKKTSTLALFTMPKPLTVWITTNYGSFLRRWKYQTTWPASWEICMHVKKQQLQLDMEQWTSYKLGKE